jgi:hypothetical protein
MCEIFSQEHHLQRALSAQQVYGTSEALVIPIPEIDDIAEKYDEMYKNDFKPSKQFIHIQGNIVCFANLQGMEVVWSDV